MANKSNYRYRPNQKKTEVKSLESFVADRKAARTASTGTKTSTARITGSGGKKLKTVTPRNTSSGGAMKSSTPRTTGKSIMPTRRRKTY